MFSEEEMGDLMAMGDIVVLRLKKGEVVEVVRRLAQVKATPASIDYEEGSALEMREEKVEEEVFG